MHIAAERLPMALAELHRSLALGGALHVQVTSDRHQENDDDPFPGRHFTWWPADRLRDVVEGAGFVVDELRRRRRGVDRRRGDARADAAPTPSGPDMRVLIVGLNPSVLSADVGIGFARPGNRFWPAALAAGLVTRTHDPFHALRVDRVGHDQPRAAGDRRAPSELARDEYVDGRARLERLVRWLQPACVCFVGVTGYRVAVDKRASFGWQPKPFGGVPTYVMPNTSGAQRAREAGRLRRAPARGRRRDADPLDG